MTPPRQVAGRPLASPRGGAGGKSGLHGNTMPVNGRRGSNRKGRPSGKVPQRRDRRAAARPPGKGETVRQERTAPPATGAAGQTPSGARPNRGDRRGWVSAHLAQGHSRPVARVGRVRRTVRCVPEEWSPRPRNSGGGQNPAYRLPGAFSPQVHPQRCPQEARCGERTNRVSITYCFRLQMISHAVTIRAAKALGIGQFVARI